MLVGIGKEQPLNSTEMAPYKPENYNSLSPYLIVDQAQKLVDLLTVIFDAKTLRRLEHKNGRIAHIELQIDDTVIMISDSTASYKASQAMLHVYVPDVFKTFDTAIKNGCVIIEKPTNEKGDPDTRGAFLDFAGNYWAVSTQTH
jgi:PhnB protein